MTIKHSYLDLKFLEQIILGNVFRLSEDFTSSKTNVGSFFVLFFSFCCFFFVLTRERDFICRMKPAYDALDVKQIEEILEVFLKTRNSFRKLLV